MPPVSCRRSLPSFAIVKIATARSARPKNAMREASGEKVGKSNSLRFSSRGLFAAGRGRHHQPPRVAHVGENQACAVCRQIRRVVFAGSGRQRFRLTAVSSDLPERSTAGARRGKHDAGAVKIKLPHQASRPRVQSFVSRRGSPPSAGITQKSPFGPISAWKKAIEAPSGDNAGARATL